MDPDLVPYFFAGLLLFAVLLLIVVIASRREKLRLQFLESVAEKLGLNSCDRDKSVLPDGVFDFPLMREGGGLKILNIMQGEVHGVFSSIFDVRHKLGKRKEAVETMQTAICMQSKDLDLPDIVLRPKAWSEGIAQLTGLEEVPLGAEHPEVEKGYTLFSNDAEAAGKFLSDELVERLEKIRGLAIEARGSLMLFYRPDQLRRPEDLGAFMSNGFKILGEVEDAFFWTEEGVGASGESE